MISRTQPHRSEDGVRFDEVHGFLDELCTCNDFRLPTEKRQQLLEQAPFMAADAFTAAVLIAVGMKPVLYKSCVKAYTTRSDATWPPSPRARGMANHSELPAAAPARIPAAYTARKNQQTIFPPAERDAGVGTGKDR
ncbi:hypothetical protein ACU635_07920 [[Actinomadura] parvosata]|uniref:hypothetical protein n=1 Tax=[Actinomadura] parvosata TaxID=1955412 RepID=UPI00406D132C